MMIMNTYSEMKERVGSGQDLHGNKVQRGKLRAAGNDKRENHRGHALLGSRSALSFPSPKVHLTLFHVQSTATSMTPASGTGDNLR
jgi:hypothetical protein